MGVEEESLLERIGLTHNEARVYLALSTLGPAGASDIAEKSGVQRTLVYDTLKKLLEKGMTSQVDIDGKKLFQAANPAKIKSLVEEEHKNALDYVEKLVPILEKTHATTGRPLVTMFTGVEGLKTILTDEIESTPDGGEILAYRAQAEIAELAPVFVSWWHKKRMAKKITFRVIMDVQEKSLARGKQLSSLSLCKVKYLEMAFPTPVTHHIFGNKVALMSVAAGEIIGVVIESRFFASSFKDNFEFMWPKLQDAPAPGEGA